MFEEKAVKAWCNSHLRSELHSQGVLTLILGLRLLGIQVKKSRSGMEPSYRLGNPLFPCFSQPVNERSDGVGSTLLVLKTHESESAGFLLRALPEVQNQF